MTTSSVSMYGRGVDHQETYELGDKRRLAGTPVEGSVRVGAGATGSLRWPVRSVHVSVIGGSTDEDLRT